MELELLSFTVGMLAGGGSLGIGLMIGLVLNRDTFTKQVKDEEFDPEAKVEDEVFFEEQWSGEAGFPSDEVLQQLDDLHRHSTY